ncbi:MAG: N-acetyltransferase [Rhodobacteraceae bacterium]|nr:N-acetyltransferase [Paracoccaceae bacterium]
MNIRQATSADGAAIAELWNPFILGGDVTFNSIEKTAEGLARDIADKQASSFPFLLAESGGRLAGFATYGQFRASNGYRRSMEHTIILATDVHRRGFGRALMAAIEAHARRHGIHSMIAGISAENLAGIGFHAAIGYAEVARLAEVGWKFGRWYDLVLMQKFL